MCGRYRLMKLNLLLHQFPWITGLPFDQPARENIAPTQPVLVISSSRPDAFDLYRWGLIPSWAKDPSVGNRMFNARAETLAQKSVFRTALRQRRCLIPADGFYEWKKHAGRTRSTQMLFTVNGGEPFAFAGLWDAWRRADGAEVRSCTLITTTPNAVVQPIHDRMPAIVRPADYRRWVEPGELGNDDAAAILGPYPAEQMQMTAMMPEEPKSLWD